LHEIYIGELMAAWLLRQRILLSIDALKFPHVETTKPQR